MRFRQLDQVLELKPGEVIRATKKMTGQERYLADHFPHFRVMPGVLMLEGLYQAAQWLVQKTEGFSFRRMLLAEVKNAKFADFVQPGDTLEIEVTWFKREGNRFTLKASGKKGESVAVSARLVLEGIPFSEDESFCVNSAGFARRTLMEQWESLASGLPE